MLSIILIILNLNFFITCNNFLLFYEPFDINNSFTFNSFISGYNNDWQWGQAYYPENRLFSCYFGKCIGTNLRAQELQESTYALSPVISFSGIDFSTLVNITFARAYE